MKINAQKDERRGLIRTCVWSMAARVFSSAPQAPPNPIQVTIAPGGAAQSARAGALVF